MSIGDLLQLAAVIVALIGVGFSNFLVRNQLRLMKQQIQAAHDLMNTNYQLAKRNKSLSYSLYSNVHLRDARLKIEEHFRERLAKRDGVSMARIKEIMKEDEGLYSAIMTLLAHWENMALAIRSDVADINVAKDMVRSTLIDHVEVFRNFINWRCERNPNAYSNLIHIVDKWSKEMRTANIQEHEPIVNN